MTKRAIILVSGGLDSATILAMAKSQGFDCYALTFDYGQKHRSELEAAKKVAKQFDVVEHQIVELKLNDICHSALTKDSISVPDYIGDGEIPVTYVPARNTIFLSIAMAWAESIEASNIFIGSSSVDYSGYPDCRPEYFNAFQDLANLATKVGVENKSLTINAPLLHLSKAETLKEGLRLGVDYSQTTSCYRANKDGEACGSCDSCVLRKQGFEEAGVEDPTVYGRVD